MLVVLDLGDVLALIVFGFLVLVWLFIAIYNKWGGKK